MIIYRRGYIYIYIPYGGDPGAVLRNAGIANSAAIKITGFQITAKLICYIYIYKRWEWYIQ